MDSALVDHTSEQFLGRWKQLISTTNWEKGQIICQWRAALMAEDAPAAEYSDEAWSRRVGNVTPQHVGRLRRVFETFATVRDDYSGLYWSHFQAALDWDDAEMWLEGAVQNDWSIAQMRHQRWEALGAVAAEKPGEDELSDGPLDEDGDADEPHAEVTTGTVDVVQEPADEAESDAASEDVDEQPTSGAESRSAQPPPARPFAALPPLPADVNDAFEAYKLSILRHKMAGWQEISREDLVYSLEALVELALAPAEV